MNVTEILGLVKIYVIPVIEIGLLWYVFYEVFYMLKRTKSMTLIKGIFIFVALVVVAKLAKMEVLTRIFENILTYSILILIIVFREEVRYLLVRVGSIKLFKKEETKFYMKELKEIVESINILSENKIGAILVFQRKIPLDNFVSTGVRINSTIDKEKILSIFDKNSILHDGAVIVQGLEIVAASCILPIGPLPPLQQTKIGKKLGTRHRAGYGISRETDAIAVIVSEETGKISITMDFYFSYNVDLEVIENVIEDYFKEFGRKL